MLEASVENREFTTAQDLHGCMKVYMHYCRRIGSV